MLLWVSQHLRGDLKIEYIYFCHASLHLTTLCTELFKCHTFTMQVQADVNIDNANTNNHHPPQPPAGHCHLMILFIWDINIPHTRQYRCIVLNNYSEHFKIIVIILHQLCCAIHLFVGDTSEFWNSIFLIYELSSGFCSYKIKVHFKMLSFYRKYW